MPRYHDGPVLQVDLNAIADNYRLLQSKHHQRACAAVVKADAYGLGMARVAPALAQAGCGCFFVATLDEAVALRKLLPSNIFIYVFHGASPGEEDEFILHGLMPVLNSLPQVERWAEAAPGHPVALHLDSGMARLGLSAHDLEWLANHKTLPGKISLSLILSHLACANEPSHPLNAQQLARFRQMYDTIPFCPASLANSSGIFLGEEYHFDLLRPGCALYGINPVAPLPNPMKQVTTLTAPILQLRIADEDMPIGYGATAHVAKGAQLAVVATGYADGYLRHLSGRGVAHVGDYALPILGRVSMDMLILDASAVPEGLLHEAGRVTLIGPNQTVDDIAEAAGTIGYEIYTRIGNRVRRDYV